MGKFEGRKSAEIPQSQNSESKNCQNDRFLTFPNYQKLISRKSGG